MDTTAEGMVGYLGPWNCLEVSFSFGLHPSLTSYACARRWVGKVKEDDGLESMQPLDSSPGTKPGQSKG